MSDFAGANLDRTLQEAAARHAASIIESIIERLATLDRLATPRDDVDSQALRAILIGRKLTIEATAVGDQVGQVLHEQYAGPLMLRLAIRHSVKK